jgi:hypothetical protein
MAGEPVPYKISHMVARIFFRGIYFPPKGAWGWLKVVAANRGSIWRIVRDAFVRWNGVAPSVAAGGVGVPEIVCPVGDGADPS